MHLQKLMLKTTAPSKRGFTLVELLVVIAIIGVLVALLFMEQTATRGIGSGLADQEKSTALSKVKGQPIPDGTSNTLMLAENFLNPDHYETGECGGDNNSVYNGNDRDINRWVPARLDDSNQLDQQTGDRRMPAADSVSVDTFASLRLTNRPVVN